MYNDLQDALGYRTDQNAPFNPTYTIPNLTLNKFPLALPIVPVSAGTASPAGTKLAPGGVDPNMKTPTVISYSLKIEQEITPNTSFSVGYVGSHGDHELISLDANIPTQVICPTCAVPWISACRNDLQHPHNQSQPLAGKHVQLVFRRRQHVQRHDRGREASLQQRPDVPRRLYLVEGTGRWRFLERHRGGECPGAGAESDEHTRRTGARPPTMFETWAS